MGQLTESGKEIFHTTVLSNRSDIMNKGGVGLSSKMVVAWSLLVEGRE